jgi:hypothetical protein
VKNIFELIEIGFHCLAKAFEGNRKQRIDKREIGQLRWRLVSMRTTRSCEFELVAASAPLGGMSRNFRSLCSKSQDINGLKRWYKTDLAKLVDENNLRDLLAASEKSHRERQQSGQYPVLRREDLDRIKQETHEMETAVSARLEGFLSGASDNINELLWGTHAPVREDDWVSADDSAEGYAYEATAVETTPTTAVALVAQLEHAIQLDVLGNNDTIEELAAEPEPQQRPSRSSRRRSARKPHAIGEEANVAAVAVLPAPARISGESTEHLREPAPVKRASRSSKPRPANTAKVTPIRSRAVKRQKKETTV